MKIPVILVCHNPKTSLINKADYLFSITQNQKDIFVKNGVSENKIFVIPNIIPFKLPFKEINSFLKPPIFSRLTNLQYSQLNPTMCEIFEENVRQVQWK